MEQIEVSEEPQKRRFVRAKEEEIEEGRPVIVTLKIDLSDSDSLAGVKEKVRKRLEAHEDHDSLFCPYFTNKESGISEAETKKLMELQTEIELLDSVVIPFIPDEDIKEGDFENKVEFQNYCLQVIEGEVEDKSIVLFRKWEDSPWLSDEQKKRVDFLGMYVGAHHYPKDLEEYQKGVENFFRIAELPVIGYGIPFSVGVHQKGSMYYMMDWNAELPFTFYSEGDVPIGGEGSSEINWFLKAEGSQVKEKVNLQTADFDTETPLKNIEEFENVHPVVKESTPKEVANDSDLEFMHETYLVDETEALE